jgi:hypothetical protein
MAQALRAVGQDNSPSQGEIRDVLAFLALSLGELNASVEETASAWERRAYWLKADRFRSEWSWVPRIHARLEAALRVEDLGEAQACGMELANLLADRRLRTLKAGGARPWGGAWDAWVKKR